MAHAPVPLQKYTRCIGNRPPADNLSLEKQDSREWEKGMMEKSADATGKIGAGAINSFSSK